MTTDPLTSDELAELERLDKARTQRNRDEAANALPRLIAEVRELRASEQRMREALMAQRPVLQGLIDAQYNVETWGLRGRLAALDAALSRPASEQKESP